MNNELVRPEDMSTGFLDGFRARREQRELIVNTRGELTTFSLRQTRAELRHREQMAQQQRDHARRLAEMTNMTDRAETAASLVSSAHDRFSMLTDGDPAKAALMAPIQATLVNKLVREI